MTVIDLEQESKLLAEKIVKLESQSAPIQKELQEARAKKVHVEALLGQTSQPPNIPKVCWKTLCREHGWDVGLDSAHRVARKRDPHLHRSIPHNCVYDDRIYP